MVLGDSTMTNVEPASSTSQLDSAKGNGLVQASVSGQGYFGNGDSKMGNIKATLEGSTFGVILNPSSPYGNEGILSRRPERVKIIVKRKVIIDEAVRDGRTSSPNKKQKASSPAKVTGGEQGLSQVRQISRDYSGQEIKGPEAELQGDVEQPAKGSDAGGSLAPFSLSQSPGLSSQNGEVTIAAAQDASPHISGVGSSPEDNITAISYPEDAALPTTSSGILSSSPSSLEPRFGWGSSFSHHELSTLDPASNWEVKDVGPTGDERGGALVAVVQVREESSVGNGAEKADGAFEPESPTGRVGSVGSLENPHTPKARRTPLFFPPLENSAEGFLLSSPSQAANPPGTSPAPAKRSPLPVPTAGLPLPVATSSDSGDYEDGTAEQYEQVLSEEGMDLDFIQSQSREDSEVEEQVEDETLNEEDEYAGGEDEQDTAQGENEVEVGNKPEFDAEASDELEADLDVEDDEDESEPPGNAKIVFDEEDSDDEDFTAALDLDISVFGQDPQKATAAEALDALNEDDLSYEDFTSTLKPDITLLNQTMEMSSEAEAKDSVDKDKLVMMAHTPSLQLEKKCEDHINSQGGTGQVPSPSREQRRFSSESLDNADVADKGENDVDSGSQGEHIDSDQDGTRLHDTDGTSTSQLSNDTPDEQEGVTSARVAQDGNSYVCSKCGANNKRHRCRRAPLATETVSPEDRSLSPDGTSPSSEVLEKPETSERPKRRSELVSRHKATTDRNVKLQVKDSKDLVVSTRPMSRSQSSSGVKRLKIKMSTEVHVTKEIPPMPAKLMLIKEAPTTAKALLATGILAGFRVRYLDRYGGVMLTGRVNETGIICDCSKCKGKQTVNVSAFEKHAGSSARHPSDFIYLENGKNLHDVMEAGWKAAENGRKVSEALHKAMGPEPDKVVPNGCAECGTGGAKLKCSGARCPNLYHVECTGLSLPPDGDWQCSQCESADSRRLPKTNSLLTRETSTGKDSNANMHKALFVPGGLPDDTEVGYYVKGQRYLSGVKKGLGILCSCCEQVVSCSQFEQHAGWGSRRNPYSSIYLADGQSLHIAALALGQKKGGEETPVENVDYCTECGDGGELVLCDSCPAAYHPECAGLVSIPAGNWFCPRCKNQSGTISGSGRKVTSKMKLRGVNRTVGGTPPGKESIDDRCTRLLKATDTVSSGCVFCRSGEFEKLGFGPRTILLCDQCEREYHVGCLKEQGLANLEALPEGEWFCGKDCQHIHSILHLLVANGTEPLADSIISKVIESKKQEGGTEEEGKPGKLGFAWQLLHGRRGDPLNGKTLSQAAAIFSESFDPIVDESSGRDLIPLMVHSRNIRDQDFGGMHCVVLKHNDEVVTAALVRIFGRQFAELPLVATKAGSTGQGYCKALILSIERLLGVLNVERLVLPAAEGAEGIWVKKFAFSKLSDEMSRKYRSEVQMMIFKGSSLLQKSITALAIK